MVDFLSFVQSYYAVILLVGGFIALLGKIISDELPLYQSGEKTLIVGGLGLVFKIFAPLPLAISLVVLFFIPSSSIIAWLETSMSIKSIDVTSIFILALLDSLMGIRLIKYNSRLGDFKKHEQYAKHLILELLKSECAYFLCFIAFLVFLFQILVHSSDTTLSEIAIISITVNFILVLFAFITAAVIYGVSQPKPRLKIYLVNQDAPMPAYFIRWEHDCMRVVPKRIPSLLIPKSQIRKVEYVAESPMPLLEEILSLMGGTLSYMKKRLFIWGPPADFFLGLVIGILFFDISIYFHELGHFLVGAVSELYYLHSLPQMSNWQWDLIITPRQVIGNAPNSPFIALAGPVFDISLIALIFYIVYSQYKTLSKLTVLIPILFFLQELASNVICGTDNPTYNPLTNCSAGLLSTREFIPVLIVITFALIILKIRPTSRVLARTMRNFEQIHKLAVKGDWFGILTGHKD